MEKASPTNRILPPKLSRTMRGVGKALVSEIRNLGDNRSIVLYTNDNRIYRKIRDSIKPIKMVPYEQEQGTKMVMVGVDVYFPKEYRQWLEKNIGVRIQKVK